MVKRRHTHVGAPENRIMAHLGACPNAPGQRHEPGTWTRGRRFTGTQIIISGWLVQRVFDILERYKRRKIMTEPRKAAKPTVRKKRANALKRRCGVAVQAPKQGLQR